MKLFLFLFALLPSFALADMADVRPMPRPELVVYTFVDDNDSVIVRIDNNGSGEAVESFDGVVREAALYEVTPFQFEAGGEFMYVVSYLDEGGDVNHETAITNRNEAGVLTLHLLGAAPMTLFSQERYSTLKLP